MSRIESTKPPAWAMKAARDIFGLVYRHPGFIFGEPNLGTVARIIAEAYEGLDGKLANHLGHCIELLERNGVGGPHVVAATACLAEWEKSQ